MSSSLAKNKKLRRSRAIKVKSGRALSGVFSYPEPATDEPDGQHVKVADRIKAFDTLGATARDTSQSKGREKGHSNINIGTGKLVQRRKEVHRGNHTGVTSGKSEANRKARTWEGIVVCNEGDTSKPIDVNRDHAEKMSPNLLGQGKSPPAIAQKPNVKRDPAMMRNLLEGVDTFSELHAKLAAAKAHPPVSPKPTVIESSLHHPPVSPKPKLPVSKSNKESKDKSLNLDYQDSVDKEGITRTHSTPAAGSEGPVALRGLLMRKAKDSGYGSNLDVPTHHHLQVNSNSEALNRANIAGLCQSIENLDSNDCIVEDATSASLFGCFQNEDDSYEGFDNGDDRAECIGEDSIERQPVSGRSSCEVISGVYFSCIKDDPHLSEGTIYKNVPGVGDDREDRDDTNNNTCGTDDQIYDSVNVQEDQDFSDWSDFDSDEFDDFTDTEEEQESSTEEVDSDLLQELRKERLYCIVEELKNTEVTYVHKLQLLTEAKQCAESKIKVETKSLLPYIDEIYELHRHNFLPKLKQRVKDWTECKYIGDIMKSFAPFLKMYTDYVKNFDRANSLVETWLDKSPTLKSKIQQICDKYTTKHSWAKLDIKAHMLEPVQRVPRYKLLLADYLKRLPEDSCPQERENVQEALNLVSTAAQHFELTINQKTEFGELLMLDGQIQSPVPILGSDRKLLKQGPIQKYSLRTDKQDPRYLFLFSDILLVCKEYPLKLSGPKYKARQVLHLQDMQVLEGSKLDHELTFVVKTKEKIIEFVAETEEVKLEWQQALWKTTDSLSRESSRTNSVKSEHSDIISDKKEEQHHQALGQVAPLWVKNNEVTMCMICTSDFSTFLRRHHCRACGSVVCSKCSSHTWKLEYANQSHQRVCDNCYQRLMDEDQKGAKNTYTIRAASKLKKRFRDLCIQWGYLMLSSNEGRSWQRVYCEIHEGGLLFVYKASQNPKPEWNADLGGASMATELLGDTIVLRLTLHGGKSHLIKGVFKEQTPEELWRWGEGFERAIKDGGFRHSKVLPDDLVQVESPEISDTGQVGTTSDNQADDNNMENIKSSSGNMEMDQQNSDEERDDYNENELYDDVYETVNSPYNKDQEVIYDDVLDDSSFSSDYDDDFNSRIFVNESNC